MQHKMIPHYQQSSDLDSQQSSDLEYVSCAFRSKMSNYLLFKKEKSQNSLHHSNEINSNSHSKLQSKSIYVSYLLNNSYFVGIFLVTGNTDSDVRGYMII